MALTHLSINLNKMALIRNSRDLGLPKLPVMAERCLKAGCSGVTIHPRPDQRHAKYSDIYELHEVVKRFPGRELNIEGYPFGELLDHVLKSKPHQCTLVPDAPDQLTSDHGWEVEKHQKELRPVLRQLNEAGIRVSLFMDYDRTHEFPLLKELGADRIELYTEPYAHAYGTDKEKEMLDLYVKAANAAIEVGLEVNAGHDLNLENVGLLCGATKIDEVSIGHAFTLEAFDYGLENTIERYLQILGRPF